MTPPSSRLAGKRPSKTPIGSYDYWVKRAKKAEALARGFEAERDREQARAKALQERADKLAEMNQSQAATLTRADVAAKADLIRRAERAEADLKAVREAEARQELRVIDLQEKLQATDENFGRAIKERDAARADANMNLEMLQWYQERHPEIAKARAEAAALRAKAQAVLDGYNDPGIFGKKWTGRLAELEAALAATAKARGEAATTGVQAHDADGLLWPKAREVSPAAEPPASGCLACQDNYTAPSVSMPPRSSRPHTCQTAPAPPKACRVCEWVADTTADGIPRFVEIAEIIALVHGPACPSRKGV